MRSFNSVLVLLMFFIVCGATAAGADEVNITLVSTFETDGQACDIELKDKYAYVTDSENGLVVVDVSNPSSPIPAGRCDVNGSAHDIAVEGDNAYVTGEENGLRIIDISNPSSPALIGSYDPDGIERGVAISEGYAYLANGRNGLVIIDVSNSSSPVFAGNFSQSGFNAFDVVVEEDYAYVASEFGLFIFDVSDPKSPTITGRTNPLNLMDEIYEGITVSGNRTYSIDSYNRLFIDDISDPSSPSYGSSSVCGPAASTPPGNLGVGVAVQENYVYAASLYFGVVNVSDPSSPSFEGYYDVSFNDDTGGHACGLAVSGDYAYVTNEKGLVILNIEKKDATPDGFLKVDILNPEVCLLIDPDDSILIQAKVTDNAGNPLQDSENILVRVSFNNSENPITLFDDGAHNDENANDGIYANEWTPANISGNDEIEYTITVSARNSTSEGISNGISGLITFNNDINSMESDVNNLPAPEPDKNSGGVSSTGISSSDGGTASSGGESGDLTYKDAEPEMESEDSVISSEAGTMDPESGVSSFESSEEQESSETNPAYSKEWALGFVLVSVGIIAAYSITGKRR
ncbi:MAG: LVIVD repeat protein [Methanolobus sp. T82-4]|nr:MAG: LVIVD repeat protein [Methanolobus sp. T82-4]